MDVKKTSWAGFWVLVKKLTGWDGAGHDSVNDAGDAEMRQQLFEYFRAAQGKADAVPQKAKEAELQLRTLDPLIMLGDRILEDTSDGVKNYFVQADAGSKAPTTDPLANKFRALTFVSLQERTPRIDFLLRRLCESEHYSIIEDRTKLTVMSKYASESKTSVGNADVGPSWRVMPWQVLACFDLKSKKQNVGDHTKQAAYYCDSVLRVTPGRRIVFGVLTNLTTCQFVCAAFSKGKHRWYSSEIIRGPEQVAQELAHFLTTPEDMLGASYIFPHEVVTPVAPLGRGSTGCVLAVSPRNEPDQQLVVKISSNARALEVERLVLEHLRGIPNIAHIHEAAQHELGPEFSRGLPAIHCNVFDCVYPKHLPQHVTVDNLCALWDTVDAVHALGIVHCDLRTPNVMWDNEQGALVLVDWSSSRPYDPASCGRTLAADLAPPVLDPSILQEATMTTAAPAVLASMDNGHFECFPADEGISMIYLTLQFLFPNEKIHVPPPDPTDATSRWISFMEWLAETCFDGNDQNDLAVFISHLTDARRRIARDELRQRVHDTIALLFSAAQVARAKQPTALVLDGDLLAT